MLNATTCVQGQADSLQQQVRLLEQQVAQLSEHSDANSDVLKGKMANLDGEHGDGACMAWLEQHSMSDRRHTDSKQTARPA
jgi:hypothetical protein